MVKAQLRGESDFTDWRVEIGRAIRKVRGDR
jgi:hypothetical protein